MAGRNGAAPDGAHVTTGEETGVTLPFSQLVSTMMIVIITGTIPVVLLVATYTWLLSITPPSLFATITWLLLSPAWFWGLYYLYIGCTAVVTKRFLVHYDAKSPAEPAVLKRQFKDKNHPDHVKLHYYHMRGAIIKYSIWITQKSPFPSLLVRLLRFYGHNTIGKNVVFENCFPGLEMSEVGDNAVIETGAALSTHVVESLYGNLILDEIHVGNNAVVGFNSIIGPGIILPDGGHVGDNCMTFRNWPLQQGLDGRGVFYLGSPARQAPFLDSFAAGDLRDRVVALISERE